MAETPISSPGFPGHDFLNSPSHPKPPRALSDEERFAAERRERSRSTSTT